MQKRRFQFRSLDVVIEEPFFRQQRVVGDQLLEGKLGMKKVTRHIQIGKYKAKIQKQVLY